MMSALVAQPVRMPCHTLHPALSPRMLVPVPRPKQSRWHFVQAKMYVPSDRYYEHRAGSNVIETSQYDVSLNELQLRGQESRAEGSCCSAHHVHLRGLQVSTCRGRVCMPLQQAAYTAKAVTRLFLCLMLQGCPVTAFRIWARRNRFIQHRTVCSAEGAARGEAYEGWR